MCARQSACVRARLWTTYVHVRACDQSGEGIDDGGGRFGNLLLVRLGLSGLRAEVEAEATLLQAWARVEARAWCGARTHAHAKLEPDMH